MAISETLLNKRVYVGIALVAMSILMLELVLTRIFSVTLWYHFAFMAISIALLGMGVSGIYVYLFAQARSPEHTLRRLAISAVAFSATTVVALVIQLHTRFEPGFFFSLKRILLLSQVYLVIAVPFFFGGLCISLAITQFSRHVSRVYFADLLGAGLGCLLVVPVLSMFTGPNAILIAAILAALAAWNFAAVAKWRTLKYGSVTLCAALLTVLIANSNANFLKVEFVRGYRQWDVVLEKWNPFSRVILTTCKGQAREMWCTGWGLSRTYSGPLLNCMMITIDCNAATPMHEFDGDLASVEALKYDSSSIAYHLKRGGRALIIGPGGGGDVLTALLFDMKPVYGVEINPSVVRIVKDDFGYYNSHLYDRDDVRIVVDEGRSYIARSREKFDVIQATLVDSWAATAAGAFVLTENHLYTMEAFREYYDHLTDDGILTMVRFFPPEGGGQALRLVALGYEAWKASGARNPKDHLIVIRNGRLGTVLFKKSEFTQEELSTLEDLCRRMDFEIVAGPLGSNHPVIGALFDSEGSESFYRSLPYDLEPPVDDRPFFFHMLRLRDLLSPGIGFAAGLPWNDSAVFVLGSLMAIVTVLCLLFIVGPLWTFRRESLRRSRGKWVLLLYFSCLGIGFMMVEVPLMQKLLLFLGHPIYALSVTLFGLFIFSGVGSYVTGFIPADKRNRWLGTILAVLSVLLIVYILLLPVFIHRLISIPTSVKIPLVVLAMFPLGLLMGMPFPMGIKIVDRQAHEIIPWMWGINGATSVFASVLSIAVAINWGFSTAMAVGLLAYLIASFIVHLPALKEPA